MPRYGVLVSLAYFAASILPSTPLYPVCHIIGQWYFNPVIDILPEQVGVKDMGGTMRLGAKKVVVSENTLAFFFPSQLPYCLQKWH